MVKGTNSGNDASTPIISNRKATAPRFSSLDGPILKVEYYKAPLVSSEAISNCHVELGAVVQLGLQVSQVLYKNALSMMKMKSSFGSGQRRNFRRLVPITRTRSRRELDQPPPVLGISNYGQTCFANAILQALAASNSMYEYTQQMRDFSTTAQELYHVLHQLRTRDDDGSGGTMVVDPRPLLRKFYTSTHEQNDAQEFLQRMVDSIVEQVDWCAYANHLERLKITPHQTIVGSIVLDVAEDYRNSDNEDDRSWTSISACQVAVQQKFHRLPEKTDDRARNNGPNVTIEHAKESSTVSLITMRTDTTEETFDKKVNGVGPVHQVVQDATLMERKESLCNGNSTPQTNNCHDEIVNESKEEADFYDEVKVNLSKDTVISAESIWIHSYSLGEEKKDDPTHLPTGLDILKQSAFGFGSKEPWKRSEKPEFVEYSALTPSPLHGWMGTIITCDTCQSKDRPIRNALCCTIPVLPKYSDLVDCVRAVFASERVPHVQCEHCPRDPALLMERQDWINAIQHASGDTAAMQAELDRVEAALRVPIYSDATKVSIFMRLPAILSLHIQRRQPDGRKNTQHVSFDETFHMNGVRYRLIAVIEHLGGPNAGHYVCYRPKWWRISDRSVRPVDWNQVRCSQAYMLFYERVHTAGSE